MKDFVGYSKSLLTSLSLHGILLVFLILGVDHSIQAELMSNKPVEAIQAVAIDEKLVVAEIQRMQTEETKQKEANEERQKQFSQKLEQLKQERQQEQAKLAQEQLRLAELKSAKEIEQKELEKIKIEKDKEKKRLAALDDERQAEQARIKQVQQEKEKAEKKKRELAKQSEAKEKDRLAAAKQQRIENEAQRVVNAWGEKIKTFKRLAAGMPPDLYCKLGIHMLPDGNVTVQLVQSSGNAMHDDLAIKAAYKAQPFQLPEDLEVKEQTKYFEIGIRSDEGVG